MVIKQRSAGQGGRRLKKKRVHRRDEKSEKLKVNRRRVTPHGGEGSPSGSEKHHRDHCAGDQFRRKGWGEKRPKEQGGGAKTETCIKMKSRVQGAPNKLNRRPAALDGPATVWSSEKKIRKKKMSKPPGGGDRPRGEKSKAGERKKINRLKDDLHGPSRTQHRGGPNVPGGNGKGKAGLLTGGRTPLQKPRSTNAFGQNLAGDEGRIGLRFQRHKKEKAKKKLRNVFKEHKLFGAKVFL